MSKLKIFFFSALTLFFSELLSFEESPERGASITFLAADIKYHRDEGIKICEIQSGSSSTFEGFDFVMGEEGFFVRRLLDAIGKYQSNLWFIPGKICDQKLKDELIRRGFHPVQSLSSLLDNRLFAQAATASLEDASQIGCYRGVFFGTTMSPPDHKRLKEMCPAILIMDDLTMPFLDDKLSMGELFLDDALQEFKPKWKAYSKHYSSKLAARVARDIGGEFFVIKPRRGALGRGVIITEKKDLDAWLKKILLSKRKELLNAPDPEIRYWAIDKSDLFIVEAFSRGEVIKVEHMGSKLFDTNVRVYFLLVQTGGRLKIEYLSAHISIPKAAIDAKASLTDRHKSHTELPFFTKVPEEMYREIKKGMDRMLPAFFDALIRRSKKQDPRPSKAGD